MRVPRLTNGLVSRGSVGADREGRRMISHEFLRMDSANHEDMLTDAAVHVLAEAGANGLSHRAIADWLRVSPARVSQMISRERLRVVVTARFALRWSSWIEFRR